MTKGSPFSVDEAAPSHASTPRLGQKHLTGPLLSLTLALAGALAASPLLAADGATGANAETEITSPSRTLSWFRAAGPLTLDPHATRDRYTGALLRQVYDTLLVRDANGKLRPGLARSWTSNENGLVWQLRLRDGVRFHDGAPFTASDVAFSLGRAAGAGSAYQGLLAWIEEIRVLGPLTVELRTSTADPLIPLKLAAIAIMPGDWARANNMERPGFPTAGERDLLHQANGSGAFKLEHTARFGRLKLQVNPSWWGWTHTGGAFDTVEFHAIDDLAERLSAFERTDLAFMQDVPVGARATLGTVADTTLRAGPDNRVMALGLNAAWKARPAEDVPQAAGTTRNPLGDSRVREAIHIALDRASLRNDVLAGEVLLTGLLLPPTFDGYQRALDRLPDRDVERAVSLLRDAGYGDGFTLPLHCPASGHPDPRAVCGKLSADLADIGISVDLVFVPRTTLLDEIRRGLAPAYLISLYDPTFDGADLLRNLLGPDARWNGTGLRNREIRTGLEALAVQSDPRTRNLQFAILTTQLARENVLLPLFAPTLTYGFKGGIETPVDMLDAPLLSRLRAREETAQGQTPDGTDPTE